MGWSERISAGRLFTAIAVFGCLALPGCSASEKSTTSASGSGSVVVSKPLPPLSVDRAISIPGAWRQEDIFVKPGHWSAAWVEAAANADDFQGDLEIRLEDGGQTGSGPLTGPAVRRPLVLPKGEPRAVEGTYFRPWRAVATDTSGYAMYAPYQPNMVCTVSLLPRGGRRSELTTSLQTTELKNHQAIFCVLAAQPERYNFYAGLDVIRAPQADYASSDEVHYRLAIPEDGLRAPLPSQATGWTTIAYLLWDGYDPTKLTDAQQTAMIDWLQWGGRLLISGPASLTTLERSFLAPYLPARDKGTVTLDAAALEPLQQWTTQAGARLTPSHPWPAVKLDFHKLAELLVPRAVVDSPPLVVERRIGRGRIVVTAFSLSEPDLNDWPAFDSLLHGCLMRRAQRWFNFQSGSEGLRWTDDVPWLDPSRITDVRYVARDEGRSGLAENREALASMYGAGSAIGPGVAAWRDDGPVVDSARELLRSEARIVIPDARFVIYVVGAYFLVLVPLNWLVFRLFGKPEWAWFAAPLIAVGCSVAVVRMAELDVGFARSTSEATIVELQPDYDRAHVSRFIAVYNSLGTNYEIRGDDPSTVALPLAARSDGTSETPGTTSDLTSWRIGRVAEGEHDRTMIDGFLVESNSAEMLRAEQMRNVGGGIRCEPVDGDLYRIVNGTRLDLTDCRITGMRSGRIERLHAGATIEVTLGPASQRSRRDDKASLVEQMRSVLENPPTDEMRLTAQTTDDIGGFAFSPQPSQVKRTTFVVAHLEYRSPQPVGDRGIRSRKPRKPAG